MKKLMRKIMAAMVIFMVVFGIGLVASAGYVMVPVDAPVADTYKKVPTHSVEVGKVVGIEAYNVVSNKTIVLYHVYPAGTTNTISTQTTSVTTGKKQTFDLSSSGYFWITKGETWLRGGTETNAPVRLILDQ